ncbi:MAG TPA: T9SS type A sorting domain-containing protein, partial [Bacteroidia bacterium]
GGNSPYAYLWTLGGTASSKSSLGAGAYGVTVTDSKGCKDSMLIAVQDSGGPVAFIDSIAAANCGGNGFVLISPLDSSSIASYKWTTGASTQNLLNASPGKYGVVITDTSGCKSVLVVPVNPVLPPVKPICLVTVDTLSSMNIVVWDKPISTFISGFNIYRESSQNGIYQLVGFVPYSSPSIFYDTISDPDSRWAKYRISMKDICGKEGPLSPEHKTIHLSIPNYAPKNVDLIWDDYVGYIFSYYHIFRKLNSTGNWVLIDSVPAGVHLYKDTTLLPFGDTANYHVEISNAGGCNVTIMNPSSGGRQNPHLMATNLNTSRSNVYKISDTTATEVHSMEQFKWVSIFPNPNNGVFTVAASGKNIDQIKILNMLGEEVKAVQFKNRNAQMINVDMHSHAKGLYNVQLIIQGQVINKKIIIE